MCSIPTKLIQAICLSRLNVQEITENDLSAPKNLYNNSPWKSWPLCREIRSGNRNSSFVFCLNAPSSNTTKAVVWYKCKKVNSRGSWIEISKEAPGKYIKNKAGLETGELFLLYPLLQRTKSDSTVPET